MQHSSDTIGAIAGALAKAQLELLNPEKSLIAKISGPEAQSGERTFRYAPLSSGLDIVRKSLGRHGIATVQTTSIDIEAGLIRLTTVLAHSSGEWISSDFPVCPVSETAAPHRLGAALTYARRYALFTLVRIAGEDDTDAPDLPIRPPPTTKADGTATSHNNADAVVRPKPTSAHRKAPPPPLTMAPDRSAALRRELESALGRLTSTEELTRWASRALPLKASLMREDAERVEQTFLQHLHMMGAGDRREPEVDVPTSDPAEAAQHPAEGNSSSRPLTPVPKTTRRRDKKHLRFVSTQPCLVCGRTPCDPHHLRFAEPRALGRNVSDEFTVPLCRGHHRALHNCGDERAWWSDLHIDPTPIAQQLWSETR